MFAGKSEILVTADEGVRGGRIIPLKRNADIAVGQCPEVRQVIVYQRTYNDVPMGPKDILLSKVCLGRYRLSCIYKTFVVTLLCIQSYILNKNCIITMHCAY